jgi:hypothetical protein
MPPIARAVPSRSNCGDGKNIGRPFCRSNPPSLSVRSTFFVIPSEAEESLTIDENESRDVSTRNRGKCLLHGVREMKMFSMSLEPSQVA